MAVPFGFGVGDLLSVIQLGQVVYDRLISAPVSYGKLNFALRNLITILERIQKTWKEQEHISGFQLPRDDQDDLRGYSQSCTIVIHEVDGFLKNHRPRGDRYEVMFRTTWVLVADAAAKLQDDITFYQNALTQVNDGIFKQVVLQRLPDLSNSPHSSTPSTQSAYSRLALVQQSISRPPTTITPSQTLQPVQTLQSAGRSLPDLARLSLQGASTPTSDSDPDPDIETRPPSADSHRSQGPDWHAENLYESDQLQHLFRKLLKLDLVNADHLADIQFYIQSIYNQLALWEGDCPPLRDIVVQEVGIAVQAIGVPLLENELENMIRKIDVNKDAQVDEAEFKQLIAVLFVLIRDRRRILLRRIENASAEAGAQVAAFDLLQLFNRQRKSIPLPFGWKWSNEAGEDTKALPYPKHFLDSVTYSEDNAPCATHSFSILTYTADKYCLPIIRQAQQQWRQYFREIGDAASEYNVPLRMVRDAITNFAFMENEAGLSELTQMDKFLACLDTMASDNQILDVRKLLKDVINARSEGYQVMRLIVGFLYDLRPENRKDSLQLQQLPDGDYQFPRDACRPKRPPLLADWRRLCMVERAELISKAVTNWARLKEAVASFHSHASDPDALGDILHSIFKNSIGRLKMTEKLRIAQVGTLTDLARISAEEKGYRISLGQFSVRLERRDPPEKSKFPWKTPKQHSEEDYFLRAPISLKIKAFYPKFETRVAGQKPPDDILLGEFNVGLEFDEPMIGNFRSDTTHEFHLLRKLASDFASEDVLRSHTRSKYPKGGAPVKFEISDLTGNFGFLPEFGESIIDRGTKPIISVPEPVRESWAATSEVHLHEASFFAFRNFAYTCKVKFKSRGMGLDSPASTIPIKTYSPSQLVEDSFNVPGEPPSGWVRVVSEEPWRFGVAHYYIFREPGSTTNEYTASKSWTLGPQSIESFKISFMRDSLPLPWAYERRLTSENRPYYVDHLHKQTSWDFPLASWEDETVKPESTEVVNTADSENQEVPSGEHANMGRGSASETMTSQEAEGGRTEDEVELDHLDPLNARPQPEQPSGPHESEGAGDVPNQPEAAGLT